MLLSARKDFSEYQSLPPPYLTVILAAAALIGSLTMIGFALMKTNPSDKTVHLTHLVNSGNFSSIQLANVEHVNRVIREGDAKVLSDLRVNNQTLDPDNNCEFCTEVIYTPGKQKVAGIAYQVDKIDLTLSKRIVFFAMGQKGGEQVTFVAAGRNIGNASGIVDDLDGDYFPNQGFGIMTKKITLSKHWKKYEIGLFNNDLTAITYPFGFILTRGNETEGLKFFMKGISFDDKFAKNSVATISSNT